MKQTTYIKHIAITLLAFIMNGTVHAAIITWGNNAAAYAITNQTDVSTNGILVEALNGGASNIGSIQVNGVTFQNETFITLGIDVFFNGNTGDNNYNALLNNATHDGGVATQFDLSIGGGQLITGYTYELQVWYADTRYAFRSINFRDGSGGNTVNIGGNGGYAIGTFEADGTSQNLRISTPAGSGYDNAQVNAYQIRQIAVPEPETYALIFGALSLAYVMLRRRF